MVYPPFPKSKGGHYEGEFKDGYRHGFGKRVWGDGNFYEGEWHLGLQHGKGVYGSKYGPEKEGTWKEGTLIS